jgi:hypothetical protein
LVSAPPLNRGVLGDNCCAPRRYDETVQRVVTAAHPSQRTRWGGLRIVRVLVGSFAVAIAALIITVGLFIVLGAQAQLTSILLSQWLGLVVLGFMAAAFPLVWRRMK